MVIIKHNECKYLKVRYRPLNVLIDAWKGKVKEGNSAGWILHSGPLSPTNSVLPICTCICFHLENVIRSIRVLYLYWVTPLPLTSQDSVCSHKLILYLNVTLMSPHFSRYSPLNFLSSDTAAQGHYRHFDNRYLVTDWLGFCGNPTIWSNLGNQIQIIRHYRFEISVDQLAVFGFGFQKLAPYLHIRIIAGSLGKKFKIESRTQ